MVRTPPVAVRSQLRREVGFGCPVDGCPSPYLTWHHFDPPWREREHHDPGGMIALCREHHDQADADAFTAEQLRDLKTRGRDPGALTARFNWMRHQLLAVVGGNFYLETPTPIQIGERPVVWLRRDDESNMLLLNIDMPTTSNRPRILIEDNWWITGGEEEADIECPPHGRLVAATYPNGDRLRVEFQELEDADAFNRRYPPLAPSTREERRGHSDSLIELGGSFPVTAVEVEMNVAGTPISFGPRETKVGGATMTDSWVAWCVIGLHIR